MQRQQRFENLFFFQKIPSATNDPQMTLNAARSKVPHTCSTITPESQISLRFALPLAISKIFTSFHLPIDHNVKCQCVFQFSNF